MRSRVGLLLALVAAGVLFAAWLVRGGGPGTRTEPSAVLVAATDVPERGQAHAGGTHVHASTPGSGVPVAEVDGVDAVGGARTAGAVGASTKVPVEATRGATIEGRVLDRDGNPAAGRSVHVSANPAGRSFRTVTDTTGAFRFEHLPPGHVRVAVRTSQADEVQFRTPDGATTRLSRPIYNGSREIDLTEGAIEHVVLGGAPGSRVRIHGQIRSTRTLGRAVVDVHPNSREPPGQSWAQSEADEEGRFDAEVDAPGPYRFMIRIPCGTVATIDHTVPAGPDCHVVLDLPAGRIRGRIVTEEGEPPPGMSVVLRCQDDSTFEGQPIRPGSGVAKPGTDGAFEFDALPAGTYALDAVPARSGPGGAHARAYGKTGVRDIELPEGGIVTDVVLRPARTASVRGIVRGPQGPVAGATVTGMSDSLEGASGPAEHPRVTTDSSGAFRIDGLGAGHLSLLAWNDSAVSRKGDPVILRPGETSEVELRLEPGSKLLLTIVDARGESARSAWTLVDGGGASCPAYQTRFSAASGWEIGPLPTGTYRVRVEPPGGSRRTSTWIEREFTIGPGGDTNLRVELPE